MLTPTVGLQIKGLTRRLLVSSLVALPLASCADSETVAVRYRVIAKITYNGKPFEASTVMECRYTRVKNSLIGAGGATTLYGEALIFDLPNGSTFYVLPRLHDETGPLVQFYEHVLPGTLGLKTSVGSLSDSDLERLKTATGRMPLNGYGRLPAIVAFKNENDPKTIFEIDPRKIGEIFPGIRFVGIDIEITNDPVTEHIRQRLPWLNTPSSTQVFERRVPGKNVSDRDSPIGHIINKHHFFGNGSQ